MPVTDLKSKWTRGELNFYSDGIQGRMSIGETADILYGGDVSSDSAGDGICVQSADGYKHFGLAVYADDGDNALTAGWVSAGFFSMKNYNAVSSSINLSMFGLTGQVHVGASVSGIGCIAGLYGCAETVTGVTITSNFFGASVGATLPSGATIATGEWCGGLMLGGNYAGTTSGKVTAVYIENPTSTAQFDYAFVFGQDSKYAGVITVAAVGGSQTAKVKVQAGGTDYFIPLYTA